MHACHGGINCYDTLSFCILMHSSLYYFAHIHVMCENRQFYHTQVFSSDRAYMCLRSVMYPCRTCCVRRWITMCIHAVTVVAAAS